MDIKYDISDPELAWLKEIPDIINSKQIEEIHKDISPKYLIYRKKKLGVDWYCTNCCKHYEMRYDSCINTPLDEKLNDLIVNIKEGREFKCPVCGANALAKSAGRSRRKMYMRRNITVFYVSEDGETVWGVSGRFYPQLQRLKAEEPEKIFINPIFEDDWIFCMRRGEVHMAVYRYSVNGYELFPVTAPKEPYTGYFFGVQHYDDRYYNLYELEHSFLKYVYNDYNNYRKILALQYNALYPQIEQLNKRGLRGIIGDILDGKTYKRTINLAGKTPAEVLKLDPNRAASVYKYFQERQKNSYGLSEMSALSIIKTYKRLLKYDGKTKIEFAANWYFEYESQFATYFMTKRFRSIYDVLSITGLSPVKFDNYINKQFSAANEGVACCAALTIRRNKPEILGWYRDYLLECLDLGYDLKESMINRPRDLYAMHQRTMEAKRAKEEEAAAKKREESRKKYEARYSELCERYPFTGDNYSIIVPTGAEDIIREGKEQCNCVAGYAQRHIDGVTTILFLRRNENIGKSFGTLELKTDKAGKAYFVQAYAAHNEPLPDDAKKFLDEWLKMVNTKKKARIKIQTA